MRRCIPIILLFNTLMASSAVASPDNLIEQINHLEQQIQDLKVLKEHQMIFAAKKDQCMIAFGRDTFCNCLSGGLPSDITIEQYVHTVVTPKSKLGYDNMTLIQKKNVDDILGLREKCVEKGFFK